MTWGPKIPWPLDRDPDAKPACVKEGDIILSDLIVRPHMKDWLDRFPDRYPPKICNTATWQVKGGQSFQLTAPQGLPIEDQATHSVLSYFRIWQGDHPPLCLAFSENRPEGTRQPEQPQPPQIRKKQTPQICEPA